ncbi:MAG: MerR family transcriptional regulator [Chloroflexi bacterium]|nr:MAG: MerR family transcriptional regulator [Chloroflexota bacterium]
MTEEREGWISVEVAARRVGLTPATVRRYARRGLIVLRPGPGRRMGLREEDLALLRRIRRLTDLGLNLAGVEVALHLHRQVCDLQRQLAALETEMLTLEAEMDAHIQRLYRRLASR